MWMKSGAATITMENSLVFPQKKKKKNNPEFPNDPTIPLWGVFQKKPWKLKTESQRDTCTPVHSSIIYNSQNVEATQVSIKGLMDKQNVIYMYNEIWFILKKKGNFDTCWNLDEPWGHYAERNKPDTKYKYCIIILYEVPRVVKLIEIESRVVVARGWQEGNGELLFNGYMVSFAIWKEFWSLVTPYDPAIPLLGIHTEETGIERDKCTPMFIAALFIIARTWKQPRCSSADEWIRKLWYIYTMEYYSAIKKSTFESVLMRWMKLEPIIQSEVSQKEKHQYSILMHIYGI